MPAQVVLAPRDPRALPHAPSAALIADAGPLAPAVARVWPRPHTAYLTAEPARRKAAAIVVARLQTPASPAQMRELTHALETWSLKRIVSAYLPGAPAGFIEALRKLSDEPWGPEDFRQLVEVLNDVGGAKVLRHAPSIDREFVRVVLNLQPPLRRTRIVANVSTAHVAGLVARGVKRACARGEDRAIRQLADRLERARSVQSLFRMLIEAIGLEQLAPPPVPGAYWLTPIATVPQIESAALRFENCLKHRIPMLLRGQAAYYEVLGEEPAVVEIVRDVQGLWAVGEIRGHANTNISQTLMARIWSHLELHGTRVRGYRPDALAVALAQAAGW